MTTAQPDASISPTGVSRPSPHLHSAWIDALFGYGFFYLLTAPLVVFGALRIGLTEWPGWFATLAALLISVPHYGATYLRVYEKRQERRRYALFAVHLAVILFGAFVASLYSIRLGSLLLTIYIYWSPWHFAGQNFGVAMTSLRRRQVPIDAQSRRLLYAAFGLGYLLSFLALSRLGSSYQEVVGTGDGSVFQFYRLGVPDAVALPVITLLAPAYLGTAAAALLRLSRKAAWRDLLPTVSLLATHSLWYALPAVLSEPIPLVYAGVWVSALHAVQYLWITSHYARKSDQTPPTRFLTKSLLIGSAVAVTPPLLFAPGLLGPLAPHSAQAAIVFFSVMNIHHFLLDGAVWKLRDGRVARALLDDRAGTEPEDESAQARGRVRPFLYVLGAVILVLPVWVSVESMRAAASTDHDTVEGAAQRLAFLGRDNPDVSFVLGQHRAIANDRPGAIAAYEKALALRPGHAGSSYRLASLLLSDPTRREEALSLAQTAAEATRYGDPAALIVLGRAHLATGHRNEARTALSAAVKVAQQQGDAELVGIAQRLLRATSRRPAAAR